MLSWLYTTTMSAKLLIATKNPAKLTRYHKLLAGYNLQLLSLADVGITQDVAETEPTFEANAKLKAETYFRLSGLPVLAEDGGLMIGALGGWPGVYSRRVWGPGEREATDEEALQEVLKRMTGIPEVQRQAHFVAEVALVMPDGSLHTGHGEAWGSIALTPSKKMMKGFPYRSLFIPKGVSGTVADLEDEAKHADYLGQRKQAILKLDPYLRELERL